MSNNATDYEEALGEAAAVQMTVPHTDDDCNDNCPICLNELAAAVRTQCGHVFCGTCFSRSQEQAAMHFQQTCPYCRQEVSLYTTVDVVSGEPLRRPDVDSIYGCVFLQAGARGMASYHFVDADDCYISYEAAPDDWRLDDGSPPPERKRFEAPTYDASTRTFHGTIDWSDNLFHGDARWEYTMVFSESFNIIRGGQMQAYAPDGSSTRRNRFPHELKYWREVPVDTIFGQVFVQGNRRGLASYHFESPNECYISYDSAPEQWTRADGSPPPRHKLFESPTYDAATRTFRGTIDWGDNPFGDSARWEYEMVFADDFSAIVSGQVNDFKPDGTQADPIPFGYRPGHSHGLSYKRVVDGREELIMLLRASE